MALGLAALMTDQAGLTQGLLIGFPALFSITDPIGNAVVFGGMVSDRSQAERRLMGTLVGIYALFILLVALWAGSPLLHFFGVTLAALKLGGGLVVTASGWRLLYRNAEPAPGPGAGGAPAEQMRANRPGATDFAFFPLTMPLIVGPGAISVSISLGAVRPGEQPNIAFLTGVTIAAVIVCLLIGVILRYADLLERVLGRAGTNGVRKIVALLLITIGVQIMAVGLQDIIIPFLHQFAPHPPASP